jgi:hypothetical protein
MPRRVMPMSVYDNLVGKIWRGYDPYYGFPHKIIKQDLQGWASQHRYLSDTVARQRPNVVIEVGVWKGASCLEFARAIQVNRLDAAVIAIDTWLGSWDHWIDDSWHRELAFEFGYPNIYRTFLANMVLGEVSKNVVPLPLDSVNAWHTLKNFEIIPEIVHIDGGHDFQTVSTDLSNWWSLLAPGGTMIIDDYFENGEWWPGVREAVRAHLKETSFTRFEAENNKCRFSKPT